MSYTISSMTKWKGDAPEIEGVWKQYDPANGKIIAIDCVGGKQISLIIQID